MRSDMTKEESDFLIVVITAACLKHYSEDPTESLETKQVFHKLFIDKLIDRTEYLLDEYKSFGSEVPGEITLKEYVVDSLKEYLSIHFNEYIYEIREEKQYKVEKKARQAEAARQAEIERQRQAEAARQAEIERQRQAEAARQAEIERQRQAEAARQAEKKRQEQAAFTPISNVIVNNIANLVDGNNASYKDVVNTGFDSEHATINVYVTWKFLWDSNKQSTPGGNAENIHFGDNIHRFNAHSKSRKSQINDNNYKSTFLNSIEAKGQAGMLEADTRERTVYRDKAFSYYENCNSCTGKGNVTCRGCGGGGRNNCSGCYGIGQESYLEPVTSSNGLPNGSVTRYRACSHCGGGCTVACYSCGGRGQITCQSCSGCGWFLISKQILLIAEPSYYIGVSGNIQSIALRDNILKNLNISSIYKLTSYSTNKTI